MNAYLKRLEREQSISGILSMRLMTRIEVVVRIPYSLVSPLAFGTENNATSALPYGSS